MSTYSTNLALELIGTGEQAGVWGTTTNTNLGTLIEQAISGYVTQAVATGTDTTITIPNGSSGVARNMYIELTGTGGASTNLIVPANKKLYFIFNNSTGAVTVKVSGQTGVSVPTGKKMVLVSNGTDIVNGLNYIADFASNSATITHLSATSATITNLTLTSLVISNLSIASANITTLTGSTQTLSGNLTLSGGTANGVAYLNASKVVTSGSGLYTDGSRLGIGTVSFPAGQRLRVAGGDVGFEGQYLYLLNADANIQMGAGQNAQIINSDSGNLLSFSRTGASSAMAFSTAGSEAMRITNAQNVGIGTASPAAKLESVQGTSGISGWFVAGQFSAANYPMIRLAATALNKYSSIGNDNDGGLHFYVNGSSSVVGTYAAILDSSGNLGIGTTSPAVKLQVAGAIRSNSSVTGPLANLFTSATNPASTGASGAGLNFGYDSNGEICWIQANRNDITETRGLLLNPNGGNLGLGVTPSAWNSAHKVIDIGTYGSVDNEPAVNGFNLVSNGYYNASNQWIYKNTAAASLLRLSEGGFKFFTAASGTAGNQISLTQAMTLDVSGNLLVGTTSADARLTVTGPGNSTPVISSKGTTSGDATIQHYQLIKYDNDSTTGQVFVKFYINQGGAACGQINANGANQAAFGSTSDQRVKENIADLPSQLSNIMALRPVEFDYVESYGGGHQIGFVAQEMQLIYPDVVSEDKTSEKIMSITGWSKTEARLVKAIQEQQAIITALTARITALESK